MARLAARGSTRAGTGRKSVLEYVVRIAASLLWSATRRGDVVQALAEASDTLLLPPGRGELHLTHGLYELIRVRQDGSTPLLTVVARHQAQALCCRTSVIPVPRCAGWTFRSLT